MKGLKQLRKLVVSTEEDQTGPIPMLSEVNFTENSQDVIKSSLMKTSDLKFIKKDDKKPHQKVKLGLTKPVVGLQNNSMLKNV